MLVHKKWQWGAETNLIIGPSLGYTPQELIKLEDGEEKEESLGAPANKAQDRDVQKSLITSAIIHQGLHS